MDGEPLQLIYGPRTQDLAEFEALAAQARDAAFTHVYISGLSERTDFRGDDGDSPWCEWSVVLPSIFKHATPPGLEDAFGTGFVRRQTDFMKAKHEIVARLGMKAAYYGNEPHWLSERVYAKHPDWRGSRCDNSLRTTGMFFAPNVDHPGVREAYRLATREIVTRCPLLDTFVFITNDSGSGYPWTKRLYVNPNGPTGYEGAGVGARVVGFLGCIRQGALDAGAGSPRVFTNCDGWFEENEARLVKRSLRPGVGVVGGLDSQSDELAAECSLGHAGGWGGSYIMDPVVDRYPTPMAVVRAVAHMKTSKTVRFHAGGTSPDYFTAFRAAMGMPPADTERRKLEVLARIAEAVYSPEVTDDALDAWYLLERAETMIATARISPLGGPVMLRWLTRPLVPHQEMLTADERVYWEPYIYQSLASQKETYLDYLNHTGRPMASTWDEATPTCCAIDLIEGTLAQAAGKLESAAERASDGNVGQKLRLDALRVRALRCVILTIRHYLQMGTLICERRREGERTSSVSPEVPDLPRGSMGSHGLFLMHRAMRWELDNTNELISLIEGSPVPLVYFTPNRACEGSLVLGPGLLENLKEKVRITLKYWRSAEDGYYRPTKGG